MTADLFLIVCSYVSGCWCSRRARPRARAHSQQEETCWKPQGQSLDLGTAHYCLSGVLFAHANTDRCPAALRYSPTRVLWKLLLFRFEDALLPCFRVCGPKYFSVYLKSSAAGCSAGWFGFRNQFREILAVNPAGQCRSPADLTDDFNAEFRN